MTANDGGPTDISEIRKRRAKILEQYRAGGLFDAFEAEWRALWAEDCARKGKTIPFEEWFFATNDDGICPFEVAGFWPADEADE